MHSWTCKVQNATLTLQQSFLSGGQGAMSFFGLQTRLDLPDPNCTHRSPSVGICAVGSLSDTPDVCPATTLFPCFSSHACVSSSDLQNMHTRIVTTQQPTCTPPILNPPHIPNQAPATPPRCATAPDIAPSHLPMHRFSLLAKGAAAGLGPAASQRLPLQDKPHPGQVSVHSGGPVSDGQRGGSAIALGLTQM